MKDLFKIPILLLLLSSMVLFGCISGESNGQNNRINDLQELNLYGNVKTIKESPYDAITKSGVISKGKSYSSVISKIDKNGNLIELNDEGDVLTINNQDIKQRSYKLKYKYNDRGNIIEKEKRLFSDQFVEREKFIYDEMGNNIELELVNLLRNSSRLFMVYDNKGNKIEEYSKNKNGEIKYKKTFKYDDKGNMIEENTFFSRNNVVVEDSIVQKFIYKYDEKGNKIEWASSDSSMKIYWYYSYSFDDKGNIIEEQPYDPPGSPGGAKTTYQYEYDKRGNWIKRIDFENDNPKYIYEREIEYY